MTVLLSEEQDRAPLVTYTVMYVDENGIVCEAQDGLSAEEADAKVAYNCRHGWVSYKVEDKVTE